LPVSLQSAVDCAETRQVIGDGFGRLLADAQGGDEAAFSELWRDANPALLRYLKVVAPELAEDAVAETWVSVIRGLGKFRGDEPAWRGWLFTTARRRVVDEHRRHARRREDPLDEATQLTELADTADLALGNLASRTALSLVAALPPLQAEVIMLRVVAGLDYDRVARLLGRSPGAVRVAAHRGLRRLAELLTQAGVTQ
jgi:RNA polymerase sigma-70 factor (ECF subfamily)